MKQRFCSKCGARLGEGSVICSHCGSVISQQRRRPPARPASAHARKIPPPQRYIPQRPTPQRAMPQGYEAADEIERSSRRRDPSLSRAKRNRIARRVFALLTAAVVIIGAYIIIFTVQVFRVRISSYPFDTSMRLNSSNYGQAISSYFDEGKWSVNPFNGRCTYKGKSRHGEQYEIVFSAKVSVKLKSISIDDKEIDESLYDQKIMAMFI